MHSIQKQLTFFLSEKQNWRCSSTMLYEEDHIHSPIEDFCIQMRLLFDFQLLWYTQNKTIPKNIVTSRECCKMRLLRNFRLLWRFTLCTEILAMPWDYPNHQEWNGLLITPVSYYAFYKKFSDFVWWAFQFQQTIDGNIYREQVSICRPD